MQVTDLICHKSSLVVAGRLSKTNEKLDGINILLALAESRPWVQRDVLIRACAYIGFKFLENVVAFLCELEPLENHVNDDAKPIVGACLCPKARVCFLFVSMICLEERVLSYCGLRSSFRDVALSTCKH